MQTESEGSTRTRYWKALSTGDGSGDHFKWIMRPELASALVETGLVDPANDGLAMVPDVDIHANSYLVIEGRRKLVMHIVRERNQTLVTAKKASAASHACEICEFDSMQMYGEDYCEVHHLTPLGQLVDDTETTLEDLAIVCANCHRILHLVTPPMTMCELKQRINR